MKSQFIQLLFVILPVSVFSQMNSSIDFVFGLEESYRSLSTTSEDPIVTGILNQRNGKEIRKQNWRLGFNYNKRLTKSLFLKSGIRLASVGYYDEKLSDLRWPSEIGPNGFELDPSLPHKIHNSTNYWFLEIPLAARYEISHARFSPFIELALSPSVYLTTRIKKETDINTEVTFKRSSNSDFSTVHLVGSASFGSNYTINNKFQLFGQVAYRKHFTKLVDAPIIEKLYNYGLEFGIRRKLE